MLEDALLIWKLRNGREDGLVRTYGKYKNYLLKIACVLLDDRQGVEDAVQDVFVALAESAHRLRVDGNLKPGAFTMQFTDLEIPGMGIPITVSRSYSTLQADRQLDFGYGWKLEFGKPEQEVNLAEGTKSSLGGPSMLEGSHATLKLLGATMERFGIQVVDPEGEPFDPELHEAISVQASDDVEPGSVVAVLQKGYILNGRLLRPAMVIVAEG